MSYITSAGVAYALGSIPTGFLVARSRGIDIRSVGSGNIGATNVFRALGKPAGVFVLLMDALKGWVAVVLGVRAVLAILGTSPGPQGLENHELVAALGAVLGHNYTCWLGFKGGKGIATSAGVLLALVPLSLLIILTVWILVFAATRYVSLGSIAASAALPLAAWGTGESPTILAVTTLMAALAIYRHRANIQRLLHGTESRFGAKPGEAVK
ncbi:MAG TPA: glycerol-3-phosphate 1-O-acyltransferase PlsY [Methylomirabilota bacterium]|nr:glycerol-3-phosphate 1-O-acyltransferase PlsY [Methylomirabilota bacterium]